MTPESPKISRAQAEALTRKFLRELAGQGWKLHVVYSTSKFCLDPGRPKKG